MEPRHRLRIFFFFHVTAPTEIYTLSLHDALPISRSKATFPSAPAKSSWKASGNTRAAPAISLASRVVRSEEHTSELQSHVNLVCRLLLEKKKKTQDVTYDCEDNSIAHIQTTRIPS